MRFLIQYCRGNNGFRKRINNNNEQSLRKLFLKYQRQNKFKNGENKPENSEA
jgi:hypothetical protein